MESKEEISDTDSGIILHSGPDSPTSPIKDLTTHTRAMKLKHQSLEDRLELCLLELKKLCIREAELTGKLSSDYPLMPEEKPPRVRRRIGAAFKLDLIHQNGEDSEWHSLEADLALQLQIYEAARRLSVEEHLSKSVKKSRLQQCKREERKVKDLQEVVFQHRIKHECASPRTNTKANHRDLCMSDDSSLSDTVALDDDVDSSPLSPPALGSPSADPLQSSSSSLQSSQGSLQQSLSAQTMGSSSSVEYERSPIQNSPWRESSLDQPYQKLNKPLSACSSRSSSPVGTPVCGDSRALPFQFPSIKNLALRHAQSNSAPSTPELHVRRQYSQSFRLPKSNPAHDLERFSSDQSRGRAMLPRCRVAEFMVKSPEYSPQCLYQSSSDDSSSEHSVPSYTSSPSREGPTEIPKLCPPPYGYHFGAQNKGPSAFNNNNNNHHSMYKNNQHKSSQSFCRGLAEERLCSPQDLDMGKLYLSPPPPVTQAPQQRHWPEGLSSPTRVLKPPPPYNRLVRTPSLREYPNHATRVLPRELVSEELKSWHQRNQLQKAGPCFLERHGSFRMKSPTSPHPPPYKEGPQKVILQRAPDGTPVQWFIEEDSEIVSQV